MQEITLNVYDHEDVFLKLTGRHKAGGVNELLYQLFKNEFETTGKMVSFISNPALMKDLGLKRLPGDIITDKDFEWPV